MLKGFDCGKKSLNDWLQKNAQRSEKSGAARTYVLCDESAVVGYYCLSNGAIARDSLGGKIAGLPRSVPAILLGRLAIHKAYQKKKLGTFLALDAFKRALQVSQLSGTAAIFLHVDEPEAFKFWASLGFEFAGGEQPDFEAGFSAELYLPMETVRSAFLP